MVSDNVIKGQNMNLFNNLKTSTNTNTALGFTVNNQKNATATIPGTTMQFQTGTQQNNRLPLSFVNNNLTGGAFGGIQTGNTELDNAYNTNLQNMLTGKAYESQALANNEGIVRAAQNLRNQVGGQYAGLQNQGIANKAGQAVEQNIFTNLTDNALKTDVERQAMKERAMGEVEKSRLANIDKGIAADTAYGYVDPVTGQQVRGSNVLADVQTGVQEKALTQQERIAFAQLGLDEKKLAETARQYNMTFEQAEQQFKAALTKDYAQLTLQEKQILGNLALDQAKFDEAKQQFKTTAAIQREQIASTERIAAAQLGVDEKKLAETARQFNISTDQVAYQFQQGLLKDYAQLNSEEKRFYETLGFNKEQFAEAKVQFGKQLELSYAEMASKEKIQYATLAQADRQFYDGLNSNEKIAFANLNLEEMKIAQQAKEFTKTADLQQARLNFDRWAKTQDISEAQAQRTWQAAQFAANRESSEKLAFADINSREKMSAAELLQRASQFESDLGFKYEQMSSSNNIAYQELGQRAKELAAQIQMKKDELNNALQLQSGDIAQRQQELNATMTKWNDEVVLRTRDLDQQQEESWLRHDEYVQGLDVQQQQIAAQRYATDKEYDIQNRQMSITEKTAENEVYWDESEKFAKYVQGHLDLIDQKTGQPAANLSADVVAMGADWFTAKFGYAPNTNDVKFREWVRQEIKAASDNRLTNPYDSAMYQINSSGLPADTKKALIAALNSPELIIKAAGLEYDPVSNSYKLEGTVTKPLVDITNAVPGPVRTVPK